MPDLNLGVNDAGSAQTFNRVADAVEQLVRQIQRLDGLTSTARIDADTSPAESALDDVAKQAEASGEEAGDKFGSGLGKGIVAVAAAGTAIGGALMASIGAAMDKETSIAKLQVQLGTTKDVAAEYGKLAGELYSNNFGDSLETVNDAIVKVHQNVGESFTSSDGVLKDTTATVLSLADAFGIDVADSTKAVGALLKNGLAPDATAALDIITVGFQKGVDKSEDFLDTLNEYSPQFEKFGISGQTAVGLLSQGLQAGARDADLVADAIKEFSIRAVDGSEASAKGFEDLGLSASDMAAKFAKGGPEAAGALDTVLDRLREIPDPVKRSQTAVALFGTQAEDLGDALYALDPSEAVKGLGEVGGAAQKMNDALGDTASGRIESLKRSIETGLVDMIGGKLLPMFDTVAQFGSSIFGEAWGPVKDIMGFLAGTGGVVAGVLIAAAGATWLWTAASTALAASWLANPITWIVIGIVALVAAIIWAYNNFEVFRVIVDAVWAGITTAFSAAWSFIKIVFTGIVDAAIAVGTGISTAWNALIGLVSTVWNAIGSFLSAVWDGISAAATAVWNAIVWAIMTPINLVYSLVTTVWNAITGFLTAVWNGIVTIATTVWNAITDYFTRLFYAHYDLFMGIWNAITGFLTGVWNGIVAVATTIWNGLSFMFESTLIAVQTIFTVVWTAIQTVAMTIWNAIVAFFTASLEGWRIIWETVWTAISTVFSTIWNAISAVATAIWSAISAFLTAGVNAFSAAWSAVWNAVSTVFSNIWNGISTFVRNTWNGIVAFLTPAINAFVGFWSGVWQGITTTFETVWNKIKDIATNVWNGVKEIFKGGVNGVIDAINWLTSKVNVVLKFLLIPEIPAVPRLEAGGLVGGTQFLASGGKVGPGFVTNGPQAIVGEGNPAHPEFVIPTDPKHRKRAIELYKSLGTQLLADGGILGWIGDTASSAWKGVTGAASAVAGAVGDVMAWVGDGVGKLVDEITGAVVSMLPGGIVGTMGKGIATKAITGMKDMIKKKYDELAAAEAAGGGGVYLGPAGNAAAGAAFAKSQVGKPYIWGGVGPAGYDCSGFMSAILNVMQGRPPYSRRGSTGTFPWPGFVSGLGNGFQIGAFKGNPGHMAGTLGGMNVESSGGVGAHVGGSARGAGNAMFNIRATLPFANGGLITRPTFGLMGEAGPEAVIPLNRPTRADALLRRGGLGGLAGNVSMSGVEDRIDTLTDTLERRGAGANITVNDISGDPTETARRTVLTLKM